MQSHRHQRVRELLKREIGEILRREIPMDEAGMVTVNDVGVSGDLQSASVFVSTIGTPEQKARSALLLQQDRKRLQTLVGQAVVLKYTPQLKFVVDDYIERGNRVVEIIQELEESEGAAPADDSPDH